MPTSGPIGSMSALNAMKLPALPRRRDRIVVLETIPVQVVDERPSRV